MVRMHPTGSYASARRKAQLNKGTEKKTGSKYQRWKKETKVSKPGTGVTLVVLKSLPSFVTANTFTIRKDINSTLAKRGRSKFHGKQLLRIP